MQRLFENWRYFLKEGMSGFGYHISNEKNREGIEAGGLKGSGESEDGMRKDAGEERVYFFSDFETARLVMWEPGNIIGNPEPPYILVMFRLSGVDSTVVPDPELEKHDMFGKKAFYLIGDISPENIIAIKHEQEVAKMDENQQIDY